MLRKFPFIPHFLSVFIVWGCWIFLSIEMIMWVFFPVVLLTLFIMLVTYVEPALTSGVNPTWPLY